MIQWTVSCNGPLLTALRAGQLANELTTMLRSEFGHRSPLAWTIGVTADLLDRPRHRLARRDSLRGDFLKGIDALAAHASLLQSPDRLLIIKQRRRSIHSFPNQTCHRFFATKSGYRRNGSTIHIFAPASSRKLRGWGPTCWLRRRQQHETS